MAGSAYVRVEGACPAVRALLPDLSGANGARVVLRGEGVPAGPPAGSARYAARWQGGFSSGDADVLVMPFSTWGTEVHLTLRAPRSPGGLLMWRQRRLSKLAAELATAIRAASEPRVRNRETASRSHTARTHGLALRATGNAGAR